MHYDFIPSGICAQKISFDLEDGIVHNLVFERGCNGNLKAIGKLVEGKPAAEVAALLAGNTCGPKQTSCTDQLSIGLRKALSGELSQD
ncbi:MAG: TIGR03905 family TSCPD domain-containing protein [Eubacteriales bacterium]|nr:TIGR03905 family TSCPD domain-containing protein [Eubacteriales bacterium]